MDYGTYPRRIVSCVSRGRGCYWQVQAGRRSLCQLSLCPVDHSEAVTSAHESLCPDDLTHVYNTNTIQYKSFNYVSQTHTIQWKKINRNEQYSSTHKKNKIISQYIQTDIYWSETWLLQLATVKVTWKWETCSPTDVHTHAEPALLILDTPVTLAF